MKKFSTVETKETVNEEDIQVVKDYLETHIPPYARLYLEAKRFTPEERETLKKARRSMTWKTSVGALTVDCPTVLLINNIPDYIIVPVEEKRK